MTSRDDAEALSSAPSADPYSIEDEEEDAIILARAEAQLEKEARAKTLEALRRSEHVSRKADPKDLIWCVVRPGNRRHY